MSAAEIRTIGGLAVEAATATAWAQWAALGAAVTSRETPAPQAVVDPEALVLVSLAMSDHERRLWDLLDGWAREGARLLSVQRTQGLASRFPADTQVMLADFARLAGDAGDRRWSRLANEDSAGTPPLRAKPFGKLRLLSGPALMLQLRAGLGVGSRADVLTFLLAEGGASRTVKDVVSATGYTDRAVRTSLEEMAFAGLVQEHGGRPAAYGVDSQSWGHLLGYADRVAPEDRMPHWVAWSTVFPFLLAVADWANRGVQAGWSDYLAGSRARTLVDSHTDSLRAAGFDLEIPDRTSDSAWFATLVESFVSWAKARL